MRTLAVPFLFPVLFVATAQADDATDRFKEQGKRQREADIKTLKADIEKAKAQAADAKKAVIIKGESTSVSINPSTGKQTYTFGSTKDRDDFVKKQGAKVSALDAKLKATEKAEYVTPRHPADEMKAGQVGQFVYPDNVTPSGGQPLQGEVFQVIDGGNMLVKTFNLTVWVQEPTTGLTDGAKVSLDGLYEVTGTKTYKAAVGTKTVFVLKPYKGADK